MSEFADRISLGYLPLRHHDKQADLNLRNVLYAATFKGVTDDGDPESEDDSVGDILGATLWKVNAGRPIPAWMFAWPATTVASRTPTLQPIRDGGVTPDRRFVEKTAAIPPWSSKFPKNWAGIVTSATEETSQQEIFTPGFYGLVAPTYAGTKKIATRVFDTNKAEAVSTEIWAELTSLVRLAETPKAIPDFGGGSALALQFAQGLEGAGGWGLFADAPAPGSTASMVQGPRDPALQDGGSTSVPNPYTTMYNQNAVGSQPSNSRHPGVIASGANIGNDAVGGDQSTRTEERGGPEASQTFGVMGAGAGGPITSGGQQDVHRLGTTAKGEPINCGHIATTALFKGSGGDAPIAFENGPWPAIEPGTKFVPVHLRLNPNVSHPWPGGVGPGMWMLFAEVTTAVIASSAGRGTGGSGGGGGPGPGGEGGGGGRSGGGGGRSKKRPRHGPGGSGGGVDSPPLASRFGRIPPWEEHPPPPEGPVIGGATSPPDWWREPTTQPYYPRPERDDPPPEPPHEETPWEMLQRERREKEERERREREERRRRKGGKPSGGTVNPDTGKIDPAPSPPLFPPPEPPGDDGKEKPSGGWSDGYGDIEHYNPDWNPQPPVNPPGSPPLDYTRYMAGSILGDTRPLASGSMEHAFPGVVFKPQHFGCGKPDLRNNPRPSPRDVQEYNERSPVVARDEAAAKKAGADCNGGAPTYTHAPGGARYPGGTANGLVGHFPGEIGMEDYAKQYAPPGVNVSTRTDFYPRAVAKVGHGLANPTTAAMHAGFVTSESGGSATAAGVQKTRAVNAGTETDFLDLDYTNSKIKGSVTFSSPGAGADSERYGAGATAAGAEGTAIGYGAAAAGGAGVSLGKVASASGTESVAVGAASSASASATVAVGYAAAASGVASTAIGGGADASGLSGTAVGQDAVASGEGASAFGAAAEATHDGSLVLGPGASSAANQIVVLGNTNVTDVRLGSRVKIANANTALRTYTLPNQDVTLTGRAGALTANTLPKADANGNLADSAIADDGTTVTSSRKLQVTLNDGSYHYTGPTAGDAYFAGGTRTTAGAGRAAILQGGPAVTSGTGGAAKVYGADGVGTNQNSGGVDLDPGAPTGSGVSGGIRVGSSNPTFIEGYEISDPAAPAANAGRLYFRDNGAGKTQLVVRFASGAVQVVATEP